MQQVIDALTSDPHAKVSAPAFYGHPGQRITSVFRRLHGRRGAAREHAVGQLLEVLMLSARSTDQALRLKTFAIFGECAREHADMCMRMRRHRDARLAFPLRRSPSCATAAQPRQMANGCGSKASRSCKQGLHASVDAFDALQHAPGDYLVPCGLRRPNRAWRRQARVHRAAHRGAKWTRRICCGTLRACRRCLWRTWYDAPDVVLDYLMTGDEAIRAAARAAVRDAASDAARYAAIDAAIAAAMAAARGMPRGMPR